MKYLCLVYHNEQLLDSLPGSEYDALVGEASAYDEELRRSGHCLASDALEDVRLHPHRGQGSERGHPVDVTDAVGARGVHRGTPAQGTAPADRAGDENGSATGSEKEVTTQESEQSNRLRQFSRGDAGDDRPPLVALRG